MLVSVFVDCAEHPLKNSWIIAPMNATHINTRIAFYIQQNVKCNVNKRVVYPTYEGNSTFQIELLCKVKY